jgi:hypothetical protein
MLRTDVISRKNIEPSQRSQQYVLSPPPFDASQPKETVDCILILAVHQCIQVKMWGHKIAAQFAESIRLLAAESEFPERTK